MSVLNQLNGLQSGLPGKKYGQIHVKLHPPSCRRRTCPPHLRPILQDEASERAAEAAVLAAELVACLGLAAPEALDLLLVARALARRAASGAGVGGGGGGGWNSMAEQLSQGAAMYAAAAGASGASGASGAGDASGDVMAGLDDPGRVFLASARVLADEERLGLGCLGGAAWGGSGGAGGVPRGGAGAGATAEDRAALAFRCAG